MTEGLWENNWRRRPLGSLWGSGKGCSESLPGETSIPCVFVPQSCRVKDATGFFLTDSLGIINRPKRRGEQVAESNRSGQTQNETEMPHFILAF